jgi:hypothetical protein
MNTLPFAAFATMHERWGGHARAIVTAIYFPGDRRSFSAMERFGVPPVVP